MVPHPVGQIGLDSMKFRSETTGSKLISSLITILMVSRSLSGSGGRLFDVDVLKVDVFDFSEHVFLIVFGSGGRAPHDQRHRGAGSGPDFCFLYRGSF